MSRGGIIFARLSLTRVRELSVSMINNVKGLCANEGQGHIIVVIYLQKWNIA